MTPTEYNNPYWTGEEKRTYNIYGQLHSKNGEPAAIDESRAAWLKDSGYHRLDGPAKIYYTKDGSAPTEEYWLDGRLTTREVVEKEREKRRKNLEQYVLPYIKDGRLPTDDEVTEVRTLSSESVTKPGWYRISDKYYYLEDRANYKKDAAGVVCFDNDTGIPDVYQTGEPKRVYSFLRFVDEQTKLNCPENATTEYRNCIEESYNFMLLTSTQKPPSKATGTYKRFDPRTNTFTFFWLRDGKLHREDGPALVSAHTSVNAFDGVVGEVEQEVFQETLQKFFKRAIRGYTQVSETKETKETQGKQNMKETINVRSEAEEMALRTATNQFRSLIKNFLADRMGESTRGTKKQKEETRRAAVDFFNSEVGSLVITGAIGALVPMAQDYIPANYAGYVERISKEMRVHAMAGMGNHMIDLVRENAGDIFSRSKGILDTLDAAAVLEEAKKEAAASQKEAVVSVGGTNSSSSSKRGA